MNQKNCFEELQNLTALSFNQEKGPLWRMRLQMEHESLYPIPEIERSLSYCYNIIFIIHHAITDGHSTMLIFKLLITILNDIIAGKSIDDSQLGYFSAGEQTEKLVQLRQKELKFKLSVPNEEIDISAYLWSDVNFKNLDFKPKIIHLTRVIEKTEMNKILENFRKIGITFNSGICALITISMAEILNKRRFNDIEYNIGSFHAVNNRRYWKTEDKLSLGCHFECLSLNIKTFRNTKKETLSCFMRKFHNQIHDILNNSKFFDHNTFTKLVMGEKSSPSLEDVLTNVHLPSAHFGVSNMKDVSDLLGEGGEFVKITWITNTTSFSNFPVMQVFPIHTYRGRLNIGMDYNTRYMSSKLANELLNLVIYHCLNLPDS